MQAWEKADAILAMRDQGQDPNVIADVLGMPDTRDLHRYARVARLWPRLDRDPDIAYTVYQTITDSCEGSPDEPDPVETMYAYLRTPPPHTGTRARAWFEANYRTLQRAGKSRAKKSAPTVVQLQPKPQHEAASWQQALCKLCGINAGVVQPRAALFVCSACVADLTGAGTQLDASMSRHPAYRNRKDHNGVSRPTPASPPCSIGCIKTRSSGSPPSNATYAHGSS